MIQSTIRVGGFNVKGGSLNTERDVKLCYHDTPNAVIVSRSSTFSLSISTSSRSSGRNQVLRVNSLQKMESI